MPIMPFPVLKTKTSLDHAAEWEAIAAHEEAMKAIDAAAGHNTASHDARIKTYRKVAKAFSLEHATGKPHCSTCLKPYDGKVSSHRCS